MEKLEKIVKLTDLQGGVMPVIFDAEFTGLGKTDELISIACKTLDSKYSFYAEIVDYTVEINEWIQENVIKNLILKDKTEPFVESVNKEINGDAISQTMVKDTFSNTSEKFVEWLRTICKEYPEKRIKFISDVSSYDFIHLVDLITNKKTALDIPEGINMISDITNINQLLEDSRVINWLMLEYNNAKEVLYDFDLTKDFPFDLNREELLKLMYIREPKTCVPLLLNSQIKHNALFDTTVTLMIYHKIQNVITTFDNYIDPVILSLCDLMSDAINKEKSTTSTEE